MAVINIPLGTPKTLYYKGVQIPTVSWATITSEPFLNSTTTMRVMEQELEKGGSNYYKDYRFFTATYDLSAIPVGATILSANYVYYVIDDYGGGFCSSRLYNSDKAESYTADFLPAGAGSRTVEINSTGVAALQSAIGGTILLRHEMSIQPSPYVGSNHSVGYYLNTGATYTYLSITYNASPPDAPSALTAACSIPVAPTANFTPSAATGAAPIAITFTNNSTGTAPLTYAWNFGDGTTSSAASPSHTYTTPGNYWVSLATSNNLGTSTRGVYITVTAVDATISAPPVATISIPDPLGIVGETMYFFGPASSDIATYLWDFGDGATDNTVDTTHIYTAAGTYTITLTITDTTGAITVVTSQVVISADTDPTDNPPIVSISMSATSVIAPASITFTADTFDDVEGTFEWDFGNGQLEYGRSVTRQYTEPGTYIITVRGWNVYGITEATAILVIAGTLGLSSTASNYYIIDKANHRVLVYNSAGTLISTFGGRGSNPGQLYNPTKLCVCRPILGG